MKQQSQINIIHNDKKLHYMVEFHDAGIIDITHGEYSYRETPECIQFIRNQRLIDNFENNNIYNVIRTTNTWTPESGIFSNYYVPRNIQQKQVTLFIPRYSMESFYDKSFGNDHEMQLSGIKYIITTYIYIAGVKVVLGSYLFDLGSARATSRKVRYKMDDFQLCVDFNIVDPISITYNDEWVGFRKNICHEPENINNTGSVIHIDLDPVIQSSEGNYYIRSSEFIGGLTCVPFGKKMNDFLHANLQFTGDAKISLDFNEVFDGDLNLYLAETYGMWEIDDDGNIIYNDGLPVPRENVIIFELIIRDKENVYFETSKMLKSNPEYSICEWNFVKEKIQQPWSWFKEGLILQGSVEIYDVLNLPEEYKDDQEEIQNRLIPTVDILTNEIHLNKENYKYLVPTDGTMIHDRTINLNSVDMNMYEISVVNKIEKNVVQINRPEDYKSNIIKPVFIRTEPLGDITVHPKVSENIAINLNKYKSKVDLFYIRIEGVDFIEIGRTPIAVVFDIDGNLLPNEVTDGIAYILDKNFKLVTTTHYKYEQ